MSHIRAPQQIRFFGLGAIVAFALSAAPGWGATLAGYWNLNEGTGTTAADASGSGNTGTLVNSPSWTSGESGTALNFASGGKGYVSASGAGSLANLYLHGMSVSAWIKPRSAGGGSGGRIIDKDNNNGGWFFAMNGPNAVRFAVDAFPTVSPSRTSYRTHAKRLATRCGHVGWFRWRSECAHLHQRHTCRWHSGRWCGGG